MARAHALLSASDSYRWLNCPPAARLTEHIPDTSSVYAEEGTLAHSLGELELKYSLEEIKQSTYTRRLRDIKKHELYSEDMPDYIERYTAYVLEQFAEAKSRTADAVIFIEQRLEYSRWVPEGFGTVDCIIIGDGLMEVIDLKYGKGVEVSAEDNTQMMLYALGAYDAYGWIFNIDQIRMTIIQPRLDSISSWEISAKELIAWAETELRDKAQAAWEGAGECVPGDWCRWCRVKATCKARADVVMASREMYKDKPQLMNEAEIGEALHIAKEIEAWAKDLQDYALEQARDHGIKYPGWKLVEGRSNRKYSDEDSVVAKLMGEGLTEDDIYNKKVKGITEMERKLGKKRFATLLEGFIIKPPGKPTLVVESDKRPELNSAETDFDL